MRVYGKPQAHDYYWVVSSDPDGNRERKTHILHGTDALHRVYGNEVSDWVADKWAPVRVMHVTDWDAFDLYLLGQLDPDSYNWNSLLERGEMRRSPTPASAIIQGDSVASLIPCGTVRTAFTRKSLLGESGGNLFCMRLRDGTHVQVHLRHSFGDLRVSDWIIVRDATADRETRCSELEAVRRPEALIDISEIVEGPVVGVPVRSEDGSPSIRFLGAHMRSLDLVRRVPLFGLEGASRILSVRGRVWDASDIRLVRDGVASDKLWGEYSLWEHSLTQYVKEIDGADEDTVRRLLEEHFGVFVELRCPAGIPPSVSY